MNSGDRKAPTRHVLESCFCGEVKQARRKQERLFAAFGIVPGSARNPTTPFQPDLHQAGLFSTWLWVVACQQLVQNSGGWRKPNHLLLWHCRFCFKAAVLALWVALCWCSFVVSLSAITYHLGCCWLKHTKLDRSSLEARERLQGKGWQCLVLLWSAVTSSHDAAELCREKWSRQDEPDVFAAEDRVLHKSPPRAARRAPPPCLAACPACIEA